MFKLSSKLALSNLWKNRQLYYPFALAVILSTSILYSFIALALTPKLETSYGGSAARTVLQLGIFVIEIAVVILVTYANSFVMKNRSKELGLYSILGMEKRHLLLMTFFELLVFYLVTLGLGLGVGLVFSPMLFACLLKLMQLPVVIASTFQWSSVLMTILCVGVAFALILVVNSAWLLRYSSLHLVQERAAGERKGRFLLPQTLLGLGLLATAFYMALDVTRPVAAIGQFFTAVLLVIVATYLLFNAGSITLLKFLKKRPHYYYKPQNFISVSNLIFRMRKNAAGLATIAILSTMLLVTLTGSINIYVGGQNYLDIMYPKDYNIELGYMRDENKVEETVQNAKLVVAEQASKYGLKNYQTQDYLYKVSSITSHQGNQFELSNDNNSAIGSLMVFDLLTYEKLTGTKISLSDNQVLVYGYNLSLNAHQDLTLQGKKWHIKEVLSRNFIQGKIPQIGTLENQMGLYVVLPSIDNTGLDLAPGYFMSITSKDKQNDAFLKGLQNSLYSPERFNFGEEGATFYIGITSRKSMEQEWIQIAGTLLFIGALLSVMFLLGMVLVIYYKQISEGYEDRENFVILRKVGLDEVQTSQTIRKQILTVFFLPLIFSFVYLGFAFKMLSLILAILGATNITLLIQTTILICVLFLVTYILVFLATSRSYRKIVAR